MSLDDIKAKILSDAQTEINKINDAALKQSRDSESALNKEIAEEKKQKLTIAKQKALNLARSILISATMDKKNAILVKKREILDKIFSQVLEKLVNLPAEKYQLILIKQMKKFSEINLAKPTIIAAKGKSELVKKAVQKFLGENFQISSEEDNNICGGFIVKSSETLIDFSFVNLIEESRSSLEGKISKELFK